MKFHHFPLILFLRRAPLKEYQWVAIFPNFGFNWSELVDPVAPSSSSSIRHNNYLSLIALLQY
jgi:hypothetical protein